MSPHVPWPGRIGNRCGNLGLTIDTSGSIGQETLSKFLGIFSGILKSVMPGTVYTMFIDAALFNNEVIEITDISELEGLKTKAGGGGGTDMAVTFKVIEERALQVEAAVILTDGYTPFGEDPGYPVIWCIVDNEDCTAPFGTTIHVKYAVWQAGYRARRARSGPRSLVSAARECPPLSERAWYHTHQTRSRWRNCPCRPQSVQICPDK